MGNSADLIEEWSMFVWFVCVLAYRVCIDVNVQVWNQKPVLGI